MGVKPDTSSEEESRGERSRTAADIILPMHMCALEPLEEVYRNSEVLCIYNHVFQISMLRI
jgi:hypothetical protein